MKTKWYMSAAGRPLNPNICFMAKEDTDWKAKFEEAQAALDAEKGKKDSAVDDVKSLRTRAQEAEAELERIKKEQTEKEEEEARKRGEFEEVANKKEAENAKLRDRLDAKTKDAAIDAALAKLDLVPGTMKFVRADFYPKIQVKDEAASIDGQSVEDAVKKWAESDEAKPFIKGGSTGGGAGNQEGEGNDDKDKPKPYADMNSTERLRHRKKLQGDGKQSEVDKLVTAHGL